MCICSYDVQALFRVSVGNKRDYLLLQYQRDPYKSRDYLARQPSVGLGIKVLNISGKKENDTEIGNSGLGRCAYMIGLVELNGTFQKFD